MSRLTLGSLCSGVDGLALGVERALGARTVWQAEVDPHASTVLAARWPGVPNLGDLRAVDWMQVEPVDVLCAGFPCQPVSQAGRRLGINDERWLLDDIATAVGRMDPPPRLLLFENVAGLLAANGGDAMARVVHGLAALGYVGRFRLLRSSDVGAPHADGGRAGWDLGAVSPPVAEDRRSGADVRSAVDGGATPADTYGTARTSGDAQRGDGTTQDVRGGAPRPGGRGGSPADADGQRLAVGQERHGHETPATQGHHQLDELDADGRVRWGAYEPAIRRWEAIHGPGPRPRDDRGRLNPELPEWMMGFPSGWVTDAALGIPRTAQLRLRISDSSLQDYRARGLTWVMADRLAIRAGLHPGILWPTWFEDALTALDRVHLEQGWRPAWLWRERLREAA